jgi:tight adherence protein B
MTVADAGLIILIGASLFILVMVLLNSPSAVTTQNQTLGRLERYIELREQEARTPDKPQVSQNPLSAAITAIRNILVARDDASVGVEARDRFADQLERADISLRPTEYNALRVAVGVGVGLLASIRLGWIVGVVGGIAVGYFGGRFIVGYRHRKRLRAFDAQLPNVTIQIANGLKAGHSFTQAMASVAFSSKPPASIEFVRCGREIELGSPIEEALTRLVQRNPSEDLDLMMSAVQIQRIVGGNLAEVLDTIADTIRERIRIKGEIRSLTAQARASGWIISLLPVALAGLLTVIAPDYFTPMYTDPLGIGMIVGSFISMMIGIFFIRRIVDIRI